MQQRGIREDAVDLLFRYGREEHDHRGGTIIYLDKAARRRMKREMSCPHPGPRPQAEEGIDGNPSREVREGIDWSPLKYAGKEVDTSPSGKSGEAIRKSALRLEEAGIGEIHHRQHRESSHNRAHPHAKEDFLDLRIYAVLGR